MVFSTPRSRPWAPWGLNSHSGLSYSTVWSVIRLTSRASTGTLLLLKYPHAPSQPLGCQCAPAIFSLLGCWCLYLPQPQLWITLSSFGDSHPDVHEHLRRFFPGVACSPGLFLVGSSEPTEECPFYSDFEDVSPGTLGLPGSSLSTLWKKNSFKTSSLCTAPPYMNRLIQFHLALLCYFQSSNPKNASILWPFNSP